MSTATQPGPNPTDTAAHENAFCASGSSPGEPTPAPVPDLEQARAYLTALTGEENPAVTFQTFDDSPTKPHPDPLARWLHGTLAEHAPALTSLNRRGAGVYVMVNQGDGKGRKVENVEFIRAAFVDHDTPDTKPLALQPSFSVTSSPGKRHDYLLTSDVQVTSFKPLQKVLIQHCGSDPGIHDLPRVMRLPGFYHQKKSPFMVTFEMGTGRTYTQKEILVAHEKTPVPPTTDTKTEAATTTASAATTTTTTTPSVSATRTLARPPRDPLDAVANPNRNDKLTRIVREKAATRSWAEGSRHASAKETAAHARKLWLDTGDIYSIVFDLLEGAGKAPAEAEAKSITDWTMANVLPDPNEAEAPKSTSMSTPTSASTDQATPHSASVTVCLADVKPENVEWLWDGRIPFRKLTLIDGDPGLGKSTLALEIAARLTTGRAMPEGNVVGPENVVVLTAEDALGDTVRPRLDLAKADASRVFALTASVAADGEETAPTIGQNLDALTDAIKRHAARLVIIDPLMAFLGTAVDSHRDQDMRGLLAPLSRLAEETGCAVVIIRHLTKSGSSNAVLRGGGSIGIIGAARSGLLVVKAPGNELQRIIAATKSNLAAPSPSLTYHIDEVLYPSEDGIEIKSSKIVFDGVSDMSADSILEAQTADALESKGALDEAVEFLHGILLTAPMGSVAVHKEALANAIKPATLRRARERLGVRPRQIRRPGEPLFWEWALPRGLAGHPDLESYPGGAR